MFRIKQCKVCGAYTMKSMHCKNMTVCGHPPKFKFNDRYAEYRRKEKGMQ